MACLSTSLARALCRHHPTPGDIEENTAMPTLHLEMHPGRTMEQKRAFVSEVTRVTVETLKCPPESVDVVITEVSRDAWGKGGKLLADG
ncbi:4-oxalocrotonate tautomerase [Dyella sp. 20L07]|uniref:4-oxalocrotonate tautomerase n=1 Tax=Dyella sp. 20L07 TaxID=3384240 RepID=UPI003D2BBA71